MLYERSLFSGVAGGIVSQISFAEAFGLFNPDGTANKTKTANISGNVVSVLQAGAFFGALGSAPISGKYFIFFTTLDTEIDDEQLLLS